MIRLISLGSAASMPTGEHWPSCFALRRREVILFDCCEGAQKHMMRYGISYGKVSAIFISHLHADHFLGIFGLVRSFNMFKRQSTLHIFGPRGASELFQKVFELKPLRPAFPIIIKEITPTQEEEVYKTDLFSVKAFKVEHGAPALGYAYEEGGGIRFNREAAKAAGVKGLLFKEIQRKGALVIKGRLVRLDEITYAAPPKRIVYSGDTIPCKSVVCAARGAVLLIHDACYSESDADLARENWHSTAKQAAEIAKEAGVKSLLLTHISNRYHDRRTLLKEARAIFPNCEIAKEGLELKL